MLCASELRGRAMLELAGTQQVRHDDSEMADHYAG